MLRHLLLARGGGGGGSGQGTKGSGGSGGGGDGSTGGGGTTQGPANFGGGGGGGDFATSGTYGGSGVVILRYANTYPDAVSTTGSPTFTNTGGYKIYVFNGSGSITF